MRVLVLTSSTGGGHDMRARAFQLWAERLPELQLEVEIHRPLETSHGLYHFGVGLYNWIQRTAPSLHHLYYNFLEYVPIARTPEPLGAARFRQVLESYRPQIVLSVHDTLNHVFFRYARAVLGADRVRCVTYCGELHGGYGFSRHWVNRDADLFLGAVPETCGAARDFGLAADRVKLGGFLLRPWFFDSPGDETWRRTVVADQLGLDPDRFILLLSATNRGANNHLAFLDALRRAGTALQVVALCGSSPAVEPRVLAWARENPSIPVAVAPPQSNVCDLMRCADAVVARPGTGTTSEAILTGCPLLLNGLGGIMPQELITVKFCRKHGIAETIRRSRDLPRALAPWIGQPELRLALQERMRQACPPAHPRQILEAVQRLAPQCV